MKIFNNKQTILVRILDSLPEQIPPKVILSIFSERYSLFIYYAFLLSINLIFIYLYGLLSLSELLARYIIYDDAFYYFKIAENIVELGKSSFDGIHTTNGYHPLWLAVLSLFKLSGLKGNVFIWVALYFSLGCLTISALMLANQSSRVSALQRQFSSHDSISAVLFASNPFLLFYMVNGLETSLAIALLIAYFLLINGSKRSHTIDKHIVVTSTLLAILTMLCRLDYVMILLFSMGVTCINTYRRTKSIDRGIIISACILLATLGIYCLLNYSYFGILTPVSGQLKGAQLFVALISKNLLSYPVMAIGIGLWPLSLKLIGPEILYKYKLFFALGPLVSGAAIYIGQLWKSEKNKDLILVSMGWVHAIGYLALQGSGQCYYFLPLTLSITWSMGILLGKCIENLAIFKPKLRSISATAIFLICGMAGTVSVHSTAKANWPISSWRYDRINATEFLNSKDFDKDLRIASWWAGTLGFYSKYKVINLDGLVNTPEFTANVKTCNYADYIIDQNIQIIADFFPYDPLDAKANADPFGPRCIRKLLAGLELRGFTLTHLKYYPPPPPAN